MCEMKYDVYEDEIRKLLTLLDQAMDLIPAGAMIDDIWKLIDIAEADDGQFHPVTQRMRDCLEPHTDDARLELFGQIRAAHEVLGQQVGWESKYE